MEVVKKFKELEETAKKHKKELAFAAVTGVLMVAGGIVLGKKVHVNNLKIASNDLKNVTQAGINTLADKVTNFDKFDLTDKWDTDWNGLGMIVNNFKVKDLGEVGEQIVEHAGIGPETDMTAMLSTTGEVIKNTVEEAVAE